MTHVPPIRLSSATSVLAPCMAAMRAARTPPDPAPMTKKSTSKAMAHALRRFRFALANLKIDPLFLHLLAGAREDVDRQLLAPRIGDGAELLKKYGLRREI